MTVIRGTPGNLAHAQRKLLTRRLQLASQRQPELLVLRQILLDLGGIELVAPPWFDADILGLLLKERLMCGTVTEVGMQKSACHQNVAVLWRQGDLSGIGTGYALSGGLWRQHSWGIKDDVIIETTAARVKYFGILLSGKIANRFASANRPR